MDLSFTYDRLQELAANAVSILPSLAVGGLIFLLFVFAARGIKIVVQRASAARRHRNLALVLGRLAQWGVLLLGLLVAVTITFPTFTPGNLISALGITGIAIGFAFRDIFENFLAGILILVTEPFRIEDQIAFGKFEGTVENIETRATTILTYDGRRVVIPNAELFKASVIVNTAFDKRRMEYDVGIGNGDDIQAAKKVMLHIVRRVEGVLPDPAPDVLVVGYAPNGVTIRIRWWIKPPRRADALDVTDRVLEAIKTGLGAHGIDMPYPTHQILFHDQTEDTDGDRTRQREGWPPSAAGTPEPRSIASALLARMAYRHRAEGKEKPVAAPDRDARKQ